MIWALTEATYFYAMRQSEIVSGLHSLLKHFVRGELFTHGDFISCAWRGKTAKIIYLAQDNVLRVSTAHYLDYMVQTDTSVFDLDDPRSVGAAIRSFCRRLAQDMPSFDSIDTVLENCPGDALWISE